MANTDFEGGCDGRGCGVRHFFGQIGPTQPYATAAVIGHMRMTVKGPKRTQKDPEDVLKDPLRLQNGPIGAKYHFKVLK